MIRFIAISVCCLLPFASFAADQQQSPIGRAVENFTLNDYRGRPHSLDDYRENKLVVIAFMGTECPLAKLYSPRLQKLNDEYATRGVAFLGLNSNVQDSITEIAAHARIHGVEFPILKDLGNHVADEMGARRTPEVFVLDQERVIRYYGRIDDQYGIGFIRDEPQRQDLKIALNELLAGKPVSQPLTEADGCHIGRIKQPTNNSDVTYSNQIARILQRRCVECHRDGEIAPFALSDYDEVLGWAEMIEEVVRDNRMPPWHADPKFGHFTNDRHMTHEEKELIYRWVEAGAPEGDPADLPKPQTFVTGWQLPQKPDMVIPITDQPFKVPAEGEVRYQYFHVDPGFKEDKWIKAAELKPGNRAVVHHMLAFARPPVGSGFDFQGGARGYLIGYVPGLRAEPFPDGMAKRIPAGSKLIFQMHYTPIGSEQFDQSELGLVFADAKEVKYEVQTRSAVQRFLQIPANEENHRVEATTRQSLDDALLLSMMPHMHLRGKSFLYEARYPDGSKETLLSVPQYDFNWQTRYVLAEPKKLPSGTDIYCVAHFDNSENNLNNPNPNQTVRWGDQTWEEMMIGYFDYAVPIANAASDEDADNPEARRRAEELVRRYDANGDGKVVRDEVPSRLRPIFDRLDKDSNGETDVEEVAQSLPLIGR